MVDILNEQEIEGKGNPTPRAHLTAHDVGGDERCTDKGRLDADLGNRLLDKEQTTPSLILDAKVKYPDMPFEQALVKALDEGKEDVAAQQKKIRDSGGNPPLLGKMLVDSGLVTQKQVDDAFAEQKNLSKPGQPAPRIGDLLVAQLKANIEEAIRQQNCKK